VTGSEQVAALATLLGGWLIGQRVSDHWERKKKQRELDLAALVQLYGSYGEFYAVWKAWNAHCSTGGPGLAAPADVRWQLLARATTAEGIVEALLVKIVTERVLTDAQVDALGALRQAYKGLRHAVTRAERIAWHSSKHPDYTAFKGLQTMVAGLLTAGPSARRRPDPALAARTFARVTANVYEQTWPDVAVAARVFYPDGKEPTELTCPLLRSR
jgi:hypothetical protein